MIADIEAGRAPARRCRLTIADHRDLTRRYNPIRILAEKLAKPG
jgi:hypothetical protein